MQRLTKTYVEGLKVKGKPLVKWDQGSGNVSGFCVQVYPSGKKTYYYVYRTKGDRKKKRITLGVHGHITCETARTDAQKYAGYVAHGLDPVTQEKENEEQSEARRLSSHEMTFQDFMTIFTANYRQKQHKPRTIQEHNYLLKNHLLPFFRDKQLQHIKRNDIVFFLSQMQNTPTSANHCLSFLSCLFNKAILWGHRPDGINPCIGVIKYKTNKKERFLDNDELRHLTETLNIQQNWGTRSPYVIGAIQMLMYTGCRKNEILALKWTDVQLEQNCLHLKDSKTGEKIIPLNSLSKRVLESMERQPDNPYVFCGKKPERHLRNIHKNWVKIRQTLGLEDVRVHDLRHTFASMAIKSGLGLYQVSKLLGHRNIQTTMRYAHIEREELVKSAKAVESVFSNI